MRFSFAIEGFLGWVFFWVWLNAHTFNSRHRADRRVKGLVAEGWVYDNNDVGKGVVYAYEAHEVK
jgi:hypothetical protein